MGWALFFVSTCRKSHRKVKKTFFGGKTQSDVEFLLITSITAKADITCPESSNCGIKSLDEKEVNKRS